MAAKAHTFMSDFLGRIANISLAPSPNHSLAPLYEAINNSIQAIEDKFGKDNLTSGRIEITVLRPDYEDGKPVGFVVVQVANAVSYGIILQRRHLPFASRRP